MIVPFPLRLFFIGYVFTLFIRELMLDTLCSCGWHEFFGSMICICIGFLCIANPNFVPILCIVNV
jgi:hypothetical protein